MTVSTLQHIVSAAVGTAGLAMSLDRQVDPRVGVLQVHPGHRAGQRQIGMADLVAILGVGGDQVSSRIDSVHRKSHSKLGQAGIVSSKRQGVKRWVTSAFPGPGTGQTKTPG